MFNVKILKFTIYLIIGKYTTYILTVYSLSLSYDYKKMPDCHKWEKRQNVFLPVIVYVRLVNPIQLSIKEAFCQTMEVPVRWFVYNYETREPFI